MIKSIPEIKITYRGIDITSEMIGWCVCEDCTSAIRKKVDKQLSAKEAVKRGGVDAVVEPPAAAPGMANVYGEWLYHDSRPYYGNGNHGNQ